MFGEDFSSDPVSRLLGLVLAFCSHGRLSFNTQMFSQARQHATLLELSWQGPASSAACSRSFQ